MTRPLVVDASALIAVLLDPSDAAGQVGALLASRPLHAPAILPFEVANVLRRHRAAGIVDPSEAAAAHRLMVRLPVEYWPYEVLADRVWALTGALTAYDAAYVALAELLGATLVTADRRLARVPGLRCDVVTVHPGENPTSR